MQSCWCFADFAEAGNFLHDVDGARMPAPICNSPEEIGCTMNVEQSHANVENYEWYLNCRVA